MVIFKNIGSSLESDMLEDKSLALIEKSHNVDRIPTFIYVYIYIHNVVAPNRFGILYELVEKERILKVKCSHRSSPSLLRSPSFLPPRTKSHGEFLKTLRRRRSFSAKERLLFSCLPSSVFFKSIAGSQIRLDTP